MNQAHDIMIKTNHYLIKGGELTDADKSDITDKLLAAQSTPEEAKQRFGFRTRGRDMYPYSYVLPYNGGEKLVTVLNRQPQTQILSMNSYELEILRLLNLLAPSNPDVIDMCDKTLVRLKKTCFGGRGCGTGECYETSLVSLRFLSATVPEDESWMTSLINTFYTYADKRKRSKYHGQNFSNYYIWYYWLCLSELPYKLAEQEITHYKDEMLFVAKQGMAMDTVEEKSSTPVKMHILKNCLSRLPGYENSVVNEKDHRIFLEVSDAT